jgi:hypothetical protein
MVGPSRVDNAGDDFLEPRHQEPVPRGTPARVGAGPGVLVSLAVGLVLLAIAFSLTSTRQRRVQGDEAPTTARPQPRADRDFTYERKDLIRVWEDAHAPRASS